MVEVNDTAETFSTWTSLDDANLGLCLPAIEAEGRIELPCNNELVRTKTLVKNAIVVIDAAPFRQWYESHYAQPLARKKGAKLTDAEEAVLNRKMSKKTTRKYADRQKSGEVEKPLLDQFQ